ncbi:MAG: hypothetical protein ACE5J3_00375 [Methanosarcinales archaeon]
MDNEENHLGDQDIDILSLLLSFSILLLFLGLFTLKVLYLLVLPGFCLLLLSKYDIKKLFPFAIPLSLITVYWPYFILSRLEIRMFKLYFLILPAFIIGSTIIYFYTKKEKPPINFIKPKFTPDYCVYILLLLLMFFFVYYIFSPFLYEEAVPLTRGSTHIYSALKVAEGIEKEGMIPFWMKEWYCGGPFLYSYPPMFFIVQGSFFLGNENIHTIHNMLTLFFVLVFCYYLYSFFIDQGISRNISVSVTIATLSLPYVSWNSLNDGAFQMMEHAFVALSLIAFFRILKEREIRNIPIYSTAFFSMIALHYFAPYILIFPMSIIFLLAIIQESRRIEMAECGILSVLITFLLLGIWLVPFIFYRDEFPLGYHEGGWAKPLQSVGEFLSEVANPIGQKPFFTLTPQFFYLGILSSLIPFSSANIIKKEFKVDKYRNYLITFLFIVIAFNLIDLIGLTKYIPYGEILWGTRGRTYTILIPLLGYHVSNLLKISSENIDLIFSKIKMNAPLGQYVLTFLLIFSFIPITSFSSTLTHNYLSERAIVNYNSFHFLYDNLKPTESRFIIFGIYGPGIIPGICRWTGKEAYTGYGYQAHCTDLLYANNILNVQEASNDYLVHGANPNLVYNILQKSGVNTIIYFLRSEKGYRAFERTAKIDNRYEGIFFDKHVGLLIVKPKDRSYYAESTYLTEVLSNERDKIIHEIMNTKIGYKFVFLDSESILPINKYKSLIITDLDKIKREELEDFLKNGGNTIFFGSMKDFQDFFKGLNGSIVYGGNFPLKEEIL